MMQRSPIIPIILVSAALFFSLSTRASERLEPIARQIEGWTVHVDPALLRGEHADEGSRALRMLGNHLHFIALVVPEMSLARLRKCEIWIEHEHPTLKAKQYHPSKQWLIDHGHDPRLAKKVHIPVARSLVDRHQLRKHPMVVLHELAHAFHDQYLGYDESRIIAAYDAAVTSEKYSEVLSYNGKRVVHYGISNHKEYFAEGTEAYFDRNDFFPFVRAELKGHDPVLHDLLSKIWGTPEK